MLTFIAICAAAIAIGIIANVRLHLLKLEILEEVQNMIPVRARDKKGRFVGDNPDTPDNEAWVNKNRRTGRK